MYCACAMLFLYRERYRRYEKRSRIGDEMDLKGRDFLKLLDFTPEEILYLLDTAAELKEKKKPL